MYRLIDFKRDKKDIIGKVVSIEYDPNRTAFIALIQYKDGEKRYILAPQGLQVGGHCSVRRCRCTGNRERIADEKYSAWYERA